MTTLGIIGSGIAGLHLALYLQKQGIKATVYSDRSEGEIRSSRLPSTVALMGATRTRDTALGTNHWSAPEHSSFSIGMRVASSPPLAFHAEFKHPALFIDMRVYVPRLMADFRERGGSLVIAPSRAEDIAALAAQHDLIVVAAGRAGLNEMFPRLPERSPYLEPQRRLFAGLFRGVRHPRPFAMTFNIVPGQGEVIENQYLTLDGVVTGILVEAIPGGLLDPITRLRYEDDPAAFNAAVLALVREHAPDAYARTDPAAFALTRPLDTLSGGFTPTARRGWAPLRGGRFALAIGDAFIAHDPLAGQGANAASRTAWTLGEIITEHARAGLRFDEAFCVAAEARLWAQERPVTEWCNAFLQPPPPHMIGLLVAASQDQAIANAFADNFNEPEKQWSVISSPVATAAFLDGFRAAPAPAL
jgi:2-polyprenyl-6-methoxyphenol hydroxylase-like FAD-dependent oxidoreductase